MRALRIVATAVMVSLLLGSCTTTDRGGTPVTAAMTFAVSDSQPDKTKAEEFAAAVDRTSDGSVTVQPITVEGTGEDAARAVLAGEYDGAWIPTRYLSDLDIPGFEALTAPLVVTNREAALAVTAPAVADDFLSLLDDSGLVGVALVPGELRRPLAAHGPLLGPSTWASRKLRALDAAQERLFEAIGATPVPERMSIGSGIASGTFDGGEIDLPTQQFAADTASAPYVTANVVLWFKPAVLVVQAKRWRTLTDGQRDALRDAAEQVRGEFISTPKTEAGIVAELCRQGARFPAVTAAELAALRATAAPVLAEMQGDPLAGPLLTEVQKASEAHPEMAALSVPVYCQGTVLPTQPVGKIPSTPADLPTGTYRMHLTGDDITAAGLSRTSEAQVVTLTLGEDGTYTSESTFDDTGRSMVFEVGQVYGEGHVAYFVNDLESLKEIASAGTSACVWTDPSIQCGTNTAPYAVSWAITDDGGIQFADPHGMDPDPIIMLAMVANPYVPVR